MGNERTIVLFSFSEWRDVDGEMCPFFRIGSEDVLESTTHSNGQTLSIVHMSGQEHVWESHFQPDDFWRNIHEMDQGNQEDLLPKEIQALRDAEEAAPQQALNSRPFFEM